VKVVVTHVPAGSGHQRAAEAVFTAFQGLDHSAPSTLLDALDQVNPWYRWCFSQGYLNLIHRAPLLWGISYHLTNLKRFSGLFGWIHRISNGLNAKGLETYFRTQAPDLVIGTHFLPMEVAAYVKRKHRLPMRLITVITDYLPHTLWIAPGVDTYVVGSLQAKADLLDRGIGEDRIRLLGIPIDPKFNQPRNRAALAKQLGLDPKGFTLLIGSGGAGTGPVTQLVTELGKLQEPLQLLAVAGKNQGLCRDLEQLRARIPHPMKIYGFIHNMDELMQVSDLIVTKSGGLTCAEACAVGLPMILVAPIPGQESNNARILESMGAALLGHGIQEVPKLVQQLRQNPKRLHQMSQKAKENSFPDAAVQIARLGRG